MSSWRQARKLTFSAKVINKGKLESCKHGVEEQDKKGRRNLQLSTARSPLLQMQRSCGFSPDAIVG